MDTLDALGAQRHPVLHRGDRRADDPRRARARHRAGGRRPRGRRDRRRLRRPEPRPRLPQRRPDPDREPVRARATSSGSPGSAARSRTSRLRRTTLRDLDGVVHTVPNGEIKVASQPDPRLGPDQPGRHGRLRHRHRQGDRGRRRASAARWRPTRSGSGAILEAPRVERVEALGRARHHAQDPRARSAPPTSGPPPASSASASSRRSRENGIEIPRPQRVVLARRAATAGRGRRPPGPGPTDGPGRRPSSGAARRRDRRATGTAPAGRMAGPACGRAVPHHRQETCSVERRPASRDREPPRRGADVPARSRPSPPRPTPRPTCTPRPRRDFEAFWAQLARERIDWTSRSRRRSSGTCRSPSGSPAAS